MPDGRRVCQNCKNQFIIEPEDFLFYAKIKVPPPTFCPECRMVRRMAWRNERVWYRRKCDATGENILAMIAPDKPHKVYQQDYWRSDKWDPLSYGREYDFTEDFLTQFKKMFEAFPHANLIQKNNINSEYSNHTLNLKNCYFCASCDTGEDGAYLFGRVIRSKDCMDIHQALNIERCYELIDSKNCTRVAFGQSCDSCIDSYFLYDCRSCMNCFGCAGLRNKNYYIFNQPYSKENYFEELQKIDVGSYRNLEEVKSKFSDFKLKKPHKFADITKSENVTGDNISNSRNCRSCFWVHNDVENFKYSFVAMLGAKDGQDALIAWNGGEMLYEIVSASGQNIEFSLYIWGGFDIQYSYHCFDCNNLFACIGLRNKQYCILNKQYTKEEYEELVPKIIDHMNTMPYTDSKGRVYKYGEFFPPELSPFCYNETIAQEYFPLTKDEALEKGYRWKDPEPKNYEITMKTEDIPDHIKDIPDSVTNEIIQCAYAALSADNRQLTTACNEQCATAFRIIPQELAFYRRMNLPLPRLCPNCRHHQRLKQRNPLKLWQRQCQCGGTRSENSIYPNTISHTHGDNHCANTFQTSYAPERPEIVYCEGCYNAEVA